MENQDKDIAKDKLNHYRRNKNKIQRYKEQLIELQALTTSTTSHLNLVTVTGSKKQSYDDNMAKLVDMRDEIVDQTMQLELQEQELKMYVNNLSSDRLVKLIELRYFEDMSWDEIAHDMCVSKRSAHSQHGQALRELTDMFMDNRDKG